MNTALLTIAIGFVARLVVPFTLLIILSQSLNWVATAINGDRRS